MHTFFLFYENIGQMAIMCKNVINIIMIFDELETNQAQLIFASDYN